MAPSNDANERSENRSENVDPQQRHPSRRTRKGGARPSAAVAARLAVTTTNAGDNSNRAAMSRSASGRPRDSTTGIERSYESIRRVLPSPRGPPSSTASAASRGSRSRSLRRTSTGTVINDTNDARAAANRGARGGTGIERSYDSVTQTIKSVASFASGTPRNNGGGTPKNGEGAPNGTGRASGGGGGGRRSFGREPPRNNDGVAPGDDGEGGGRRRSFGREPPPVSSTDSVVGSSVPAVTNSMSFGNASTAASAVGHIISASASMSTDDFDRLRRESRLLKAAHEARYGQGGVSAAPSRDFTAEQSMAETKASTKAGGRSSDKARDGSMSKHASRASHSSDDKANDHCSSSNNKAFTNSTATNVISNKSRRSGSTGNKNNGQSSKTSAKKGWNGLSKIRGILNMNSNDSSDAMSFFCSDEDTGQAAKQKLSLDRSESGGEDIDRMLSYDGDGSDGYHDGTFMNQAPNDKRAGSRAPPQSPMTSTSDKRSKLKRNEEVVQDAFRVARDSTDTANRGSSSRTPGKEGGVDFVAKDVASRIGTGIAGAAMGVVKVTQQSVEGVGMMVQDLANAKTPARSNVTRRQGDHHLQQQLFRDGQQMNNGKYADYVHDPHYRVILTPPPRPNGVNNAGRTPYTYCDPQTPGLLVGAVTAARCNLPGTHPESLDFLPEGIPRVLVVPEDWEEQAGFESTRAGGATAGGAGLAIGVTGMVGGMSEAIGQGLNGGMRSGSPRVSNPIDMDEECDTVNGEEVDREEMLALREGRPSLSPRNGNGRQQARPSFDRISEEEEENDDEGEEKNADEEKKEALQSDDGKSGEISEEDENDPRNASMWVAVPADVDDDDEELLDSTMHVGDINIGELLLEEQHKEHIETDLVQLAKEYDGWTPTSMGSDTFFVGDVRIGFESIQGNEESDDDLIRLRQSEGSAIRALEAPVAAARKIEDLDVRHKGLPQAPAYMKSEDEDSLVSLAKATTAAVVNDKRKEFETPFSVKKGERQLSFEEFKAMNKQVLFDLKNNDDGEARAKELYSMERLDDAGLCLNPSGSTELSHEPPVRTVGGDSSRQELYLNPSQSTDLSQLSNWKDAGAGKDARHSNGTGGTTKESKSSGKRQLKGRVILVRIKKKISKVARKMLFKPFGSKASKEAESIMEESFVISVAKSNHPIPASPSSMVSGMSISSSIMTGQESGTKRIIGAIPPKNGTPNDQSHQFLYGAIKYGVRSMEDSTVDGSEALPAPPAVMPRPLMGSCDEEDAVSYLAEAMRQSKRKDNDEEDSVLLLLTPREDGTEDCQVISAMDGTPVQMRDIIEAGNGDTDLINSGVKPNNLACLFMDEQGNGVHGTPIQIMDAVEVDGELILTPRDINHNMSQVFRPSNDSSSATNLLPGSTIDSDDDEDETLLYHDGCTVIHQTSTFGDNTIATMTTVKEGQETDNEESSVVKEGESQVVVAVMPSAADMGIGTPILSPDGRPLTRQAANNGSFLFSPDNMGRANPSIRAKERALLKEGKVKPSITMLPPPSKQTMKSAAGEGTMVVRQSYSYESSVNAILRQCNDSAIVAVADEGTGNDNSATLVAADERAAEHVEGGKAIMSSMTEDRRFSYNTLRNQFSTDASSDDGILQKSVEEPSATSSPDISIEAQEDKTPLVSNAASTKEKSPVTTFSEAEIRTVDSTDTSPLIVTLNNACSRPSSPSSGSISSFRSAKGKKKGSPKFKSAPKSALKTRKGFVKERVTDIHQRIEGSSASGAVTDVNGRLKRNHSYRLKNLRRMTNGNGVLAPRKAVLQTTYIRSVPIGIAKSYSRDSINLSFSQDTGYSISQEDRVPEENVQQEDTTSYVLKYTAESANATTKPVDTLDESPPSARKGNRSFSDASSYVSETTDSDPFSSLLGKMESEEEESGSSEDESHAADDDEQGGAAHGSSGKENAGNVDGNLSSPSTHLPFKSSTLVKPTELHQHGQHEQRQQQQQQQQQRAALSPVISPPPMQARKWRTMAAAAAEKNASARFRSEKSWRQISGNDLS